MLFRDVYGQDYCGQWAQLSTNVNPFLGASKNSKEEMIAVRMQIRFFFSDQTLEQTRQTLG